MRTSEVTLLHAAIRKAAAEFEELDWTRDGDVICGEIMERLTALLPDEVSSLPDPDYQEEAPWFSDKY